VRIWTWKKDMRFFHQKFLLKINFEKNQFVNEFIIFLVILNNNKKFQKNLKTKHENNRFNNDTLEISQDLQIDLAEFKRLSDVFSKKPSFLLKTPSNLLFLKH